MGRIFAQVKLSSFSDPDKAMTVSALVDTGAAYVTLPNAWRDTFGPLDRLADVEVELANQSRTAGSLCGPVRVQIDQFRPIVGEILFLDMQPDEDGRYEPLVGYIALEQAGAAVDMLGHRLMQVKHVDLK